MLKSGSVSSLPELDVGRDDCDAVSDARVNVAGLERSYPTSSGVRCCNWPSWEVHQGHDSRMNAAGSVQEYLKIKCCQLFSAR